MLLKRLAVALVALLLALVPFAANAQTGVTLQTGFQVQNLGTGTATVTVTYYNLDGGTIANTQTVSIAQGASYTFFGSTMDVPAGFKGSVVISADQPIAAVGNILGTLSADSSKNAGSYNGFSAGATSINLPLLQKNNSGIDSFVAVQNAGEVDANIKIDYVPNAGFGNAGSQTATIKKGQSYIFDQATFADIGTRFVGSATVSSTNSQPIVAVVSQIGKGGSKTQATYDGFVGGAPTVLLPLIQAFNGGAQIFVGIQVQNTGTQPTNVTITYSANSLTGNNLCATPAPTVQPNVAPGASFFVLTDTAAFAPGSCRYVGSAVVTNSANQNLVAVVNQLDKVGLNKGGSTYEGFNPATATKSVNAPLLMANNANIFTGVQVQNTGGAATNITLTFSPNTLTSGSNLCPAIAAVTRQVPANSSVTLLQNVGLPVANCRYVGSGVVTSDSQNIVAVVNQVQLPSSGGDQVLTYNAFNQ